MFSQDSIVLLGGFAEIFILGWGVGWWSNEIKRISRSTSRFKFCHEVKINNIWDGKTDPHSEVFCPG